MSRSEHSPTHAATLQSSQRAAQSTTSPSISPIHSSPRSPRNGRVDSTSAMSLSSLQTLPWPTSPVEPTSTKGRALFLASYTTVPRSVSDRSNTQSMDSSTDRDSAYSSSSSTVDSMKSSKLSSIFRRKDASPSTRGRRNTQHTVSFMPSFSSPRDITIDWQPTGPIKKPAGSVTMQSAFEGPNIDTDDKQIDQVLPAEPAKTAYERRMERRSAYTNNFINAPPTIALPPLPPHAKIDSVNNSNKVLPGRNEVFTNSSSPFRT